MAKEREERLMKKFKEIVFGIVAVVLVAALGFGGGCWYMTNRAEKDALVVDDNTPDLKLPGEKEKRIVTVDEIETKLVEIGELSTYSGEYTVTREADYSRYFIDDIKIPGTTNTVHIECQGIVKVGYNIDDVNIKVDNDSFKIYIGLPEPTVNDNYVIWDTVKCVEANNFLNPIDFAQYQELINEIEADGLKQSEEKGIYKAAEENVKKIVVNFLSGFEGFEIIFM